MEFLITSEALFCDSVKYELKKITLEELFEFRKSKIPGVVIKKDGNFYYSQIPKDIRFFFKKIGEHKCSDSCSKMSAASNECGGCAKVRDRSFHFYSKNKMYSLEKAIEASDRIEKYDFIKYGLESFNVKLPALVVFECENYEKVVANNKRKADRDALLLGLAQYINPNIETFEDIDEFFKV